MIEVTSSEIPDDWAERWSDFHKPVLVGERVWIRPSWEDPAAEGLIDLVVDPGQAFGTGAHQTTRLCIELLIELADEGRARGPLADWGTGSGVLGIAASKLGWGPVTGCDHEISALDAAAANAKANGVVLELLRVNLRESSPPSAPCVIANLTAPVLIEIADRLAAGDSGVPSTLVCSGMLAVEVDSIALTLREAGFAERTRRSSGDWGALLLEREQGVE